MEVVCDCYPDDIAAPVSLAGWEGEGVEVVAGTDCISMCLGGGGGEASTNSRVGIMWIPCGLDERAGRWRLEWRSWIKYYQFWKVVLWIGNMVWWIRKADYPSVVNLYHDQYLYLPYVTPSII